MLELLSKYFPSSVVSHLNSIEDKRDNNNKKKKGNVEAKQQYSKILLYLSARHSCSSGSCSNVTTADKFEFKKKKKKQTVLRFVLSHTSADMTPF